VLTHAPNVADHAATYGPSVIVAGHTHGGHVKIPRLTAHIMRRMGNRYLAGFYGVNGSMLYVNCGIGSSSIPIRAGAPSEVAILTLRAPPADSSAYSRHSTPPSTSAQIPVGQTTRSESY